MSVLTDTVDVIMERVPAHLRWSKWCGGGPCACLGCVNNAGDVGRKITKAMWEDWKQRNDRRKV